jgi:RimJ/RimL family protein N-acetyltransferase
MRFPDDVPVLSDGRVTLRAHCADDVEGVFEQSTDPATQQFTTVPVPYTWLHAEEFVGSRAAEWESGGKWSFAVEAAGGGGASGYGGSISVQDRGSGVGEIGFGAHPGVRGAGIMTTAVRLILDWAFEARQLRAILWQAQAGNYGSWRVAWKNGFTWEGTSRRTLTRRGDPVDAWRATLLASDSREPKTRWLWPVPLSADGVVLRELSAYDERRYLQTINNPESQQWLATLPFARTPEAFQSKFLNRKVGASRGESVSWTVCDPVSDAYLGSITLFDLTGLDYRSAEVGYRTHPDARGRGVLKSALRAVLAHAFAPESQGGLGLERIRLGAGDGNFASQAVARSLGFTETGRDRSCYELNDGTVVDLVRFDLLRSEFRAIS